MSLLQLTESSLKSNYAFQGGTGGEGRGSLQTVKKLKDHFCFTFSVIMVVCYPVMI